MRPAGRAQPFGFAFAVPARSAGETMADKQGRRAATGDL